MEHNYVDIENGKTIECMVINERNNNLDKIDNLDSLPAAPAVYAICGTINGKPVNPRIVDETDNLRKAIRSHFDPGVTHPDRLFKEFMLSIKVKMLVYELMPKSTAEDRSDKRLLWEQRYNPKSDAVLNEIH